MDAPIVLTLHAWATAQPWLSNLVVLVAEAGMFVLPVALVLLWFRSGRFFTSSSRTDHRELVETREAVVVGFVAAVVAFALTLVIEQFLIRPRPFVALGFTPLFPHAADSSFPSDHTLLGVALAGPMLWRAPKLGGWLVAWALVVGGMRVAAGVHYPSDVAGSALLGLAVDAVVWIALYPVLERLNLRSSDGPRLRSRPGGRRR